MLKIFLRLRRSLADNCHGGTETVITSVASPVISAVTGQGGDQVVLASRCCLAVWACGSFELACGSFERARTITAASLGI